MSDCGTTLRELLAIQSIDVTDAQLDQFSAYYRDLVSWNERMNLTAITDKEQVYLKHFYDSISLAFFYPMDRVETMADIGSGAGFPSIPLKIMYPHVKVTIIDSLQKRIGFLQTLTKTLGLSDIQCIHARAEDAGQHAAYRESFDLVTARAVARLNVLAEFCLPFAARGGAFIAMKGADTEAEVKEASLAIRELGGKIAGEHHFQLPGEGSKRRLYVIRKEKATPKRYPRKAGVPLKSPLLADGRNG